ncbi:MAG TPA: iron chelate uptake ABC transporter family permease subunit [Armatimonadota bacterium]|nr:iron chelate uptake ABC transporter family permease subunit [Armatimonadota bacterium]
MSSITTEKTIPVKVSVTAKLARSSAVLLGLLIVAVILSASVGAITVSPAMVAKVIANHLFSASYAVSEPIDRIIWQIHIPRMLLGALVGMTLAMAGVVLQGLLLNPLADPYMIGVSSGAAVGAGLAVILGLSGILMGFGIPVFAFISALIAVLAVYLLAHRGGKVSVLSFILAGVVIGSFMWAALTFLMTVASQNLETIVFWTMGSLAGSDPWSRVLMLTPFAFLGFFALYAFARDLNLFALGEESARYLGLEVESLKRILIGAVTLMTAAAVSVSGTIGFVGLMVPHITRRLVGPDHRVLLPCSALLGATFMIAADAIARTAMAPSEIPVGVITALLGAPFFLYLLRKAG